ncbi:hypothetical protein CTheo_8085 [Ceratobasidium theobromae]|uniref:Uncharacterized protein n=1 Tax=Ceratobasidium theobromae TaxID=1582974 RepID=A0A5N5QAP1_9AGAM|nr:hypothetical protein CTheo_8085 [Ceratobasidium theobromae]
MADSLPPYTPVWPNPELHIVERRVHEIVVNPPRIELVTYEPLNALFCMIFQPVLPNPHIVHPQAPLRMPLPEPPLPNTSTSYPTFDLSIEAEPSWDTSDDSLGSTVDLLSREANVGNNSISSIGDQIFPVPPPGEISITNHYVPAIGRGQGRIPPGDLKIPDFIISRVHPDGCFTRGGGPDIIRLVVEVKGHYPLSEIDRNQLMGYALRLSSMSAVDSGLLVIIQGDAYFWRYEELIHPGIFSPVAMTARPHWRIDSMEFPRFLHDWEAVPPSVPL